MKKPNILFIMSDQMRHDVLGCNGNSHIRTPNYDRLAKRGVNFSDSYTPNPICVPARASITTGCYSNKCTGQKDNDGNLTFLLHNSKWRINIIRKNTDI